MLRAILVVAVQADWVGRSPCRAVKLPHIKGTRRQILNPVDVAKVADSTPEDYRAMVWIGAVLGLRWSEVAGLRVGRVDVLRQELTVAEASQKPSRTTPPLPR